MRPEMVENGLKFLRHPNVQATPLSERVSFLEQKGMTKEEIQEAIEQYQADPTPSAPTGGASPVAQAVSAAAPMVVAAAAPVQQLMQRRARMPTYLKVLLTISSVVGVATILGFVWQFMLSAGYFPWLRPSRPMLEAAKTTEETEEEKEKEKTLLASLQNVSTAIQSQTEELTKLCSAMDKKEDELLLRQRTTSQISSVIAEQSTAQAIAELKAEVTTLKALLLSKDSHTSTSEATIGKPSTTAVAEAATANVSLSSTSPLAALPSMQQQQALATKETAAQRMENALKKFRQENPMDQLKLASGILIMYVKNLVENPEVPRYRRIAPANANFKQKIEPLKHHEELLKSVGFESTGLNMEWKWHLLNRENGEFDEHLAILKALLKALQAVAASRTNDPIALEEIAHQSLAEFYEQREEQKTQKAVEEKTAAGQDGTSTALTTSVTSNAVTSTASTSMEQRKADTDLQAFLTRLEQKTSKTWEEKTVTADPVAVEPTKPVPVDVSTVQSDTTTTVDATAAASGPAYPKSFTEVMEMLKKGETVPGIQQIEDRVSDDAAKFLAETTETPADAAVAKPLPAKPWEKR